MPATKLTEEQQILAMAPEHYMNSRQQAFFRQRLEQEKHTLLTHIEALKQQLHSGGDTHGDEADKAMREEELRLLFRQIDRESRLLPKIDAALTRLRQGEYGYCLETGEAIGLPRLLLRPTAELSIDAKAAQEIRELGYRK